MISLFKQSRFFKYCNSVTHECGLVQENTNSRSKMEMFIGMKIIPRLLSREKRIYEFYKKKIQLSLN